jgi:hypothetical protein
MKEQIQQAVASLQKISREVYDIPSSSDNISDLLDEAGDRIDEAIEILNTIDTDKEE